MQLPTEPAETTYAITVDPANEAAAPAGAGHAAAQHGMLRIARDADGSWSAGPVHGALMMTLAQTAEWLGAYGRPTPMI